ncbi:MAG: dihydrodipicolinate synthase family protein [Nitrososphaeria archaeon]
MKFEGIITPLITPFKEDRVYKEGLKELINFQVEKNVNGLFICGTYGSGPAMTLEERKKVAEIIVEQVKNKMDTIVNVSSSCIEASLELAKHSEDIGAHAIATTAPFYYLYEEESIISFFKQLLSRVNIPVFAYDYPERVGMVIHSELLNKLAKEGVAGIKDSSFNMIKFYESISMMEKKDFIFLIGTEELMLPAMMAGAKGCVPGLSNIYPEIMIEFYKLIKDRKFQEAAIKQIEVVRLTKILHPTMNACYEILKLRGIDVGQPKKPFKRLSKEEIDALKEKLIKLNLI